MVITAIVRTKVTFADVTRISIMLREKTLTSAMIIMGMIAQVISSMA